MQKAQNGQSDLLTMEYMAKELRNIRPPSNVMNWIRNKENQVIKAAKPERNDPCPCGSGRKFKNCCARFEVRSVR
jgi:uncharacterized protein YecA (UPF0149 family)